MTRLYKLWADELRKEKHERIRGFALLERTEAVFQHLFFNLASYPAGRY